jgi:hypothetical protein
MGMGMAFSLPAVQGQGDHSSNIQRFSDIVFLGWGLAY